MFLAVADEEYGRQIPFAFLDKVKEDFTKQHGESAKTAVANGLQRVYGRAPFTPAAAASPALLLLGPAVWAAAH